MEITSSCKEVIRIFYVVLAFIYALLLGALKGVLVGPIAGLIVIIGNIGVILGLFPAHVVWTVYTIVNTNRYDLPLKIAVLVGLPGLFGLWLGLSLVSSVVVGAGYGFFTPWVSTFEAFRQERVSRKLLHCIVDGTYETIKGSCTVIRDFADMLYHSYPLFLKEIREGLGPFSGEAKTLRFIHVPACIVVVLMGLIVEIPLYTVIAVLKSPYLLFLGWYRLLHDLISREGPFLETACIPVAGLAILIWPLIVVGSILISILSSIFVGLYGSVIVYQERSFKRGAAYVIAMVAEFDEYTNDWLYLREGSIFPKPQYRKKRTPSSMVLSDGQSRGGSRSGVISTDAPALMVANLAPSRSVRETIKEVKMVQVWDDMMKSCEVRGKQLLDSNVITSTDLFEWLKTKSGNESSIIGVGLPSYSFLQRLLNSIKAGSDGLLMLDGDEINHYNRPQDRLLDWFFQPIMVLKEQIKVRMNDEGEIRFLEKIVLFGGNTERMEAWDNGCIIPQDALRVAQIQGISRRLAGLVRSVSKFPTYRRRYIQVVKSLIAYSLEKESSSMSNSMRSHQSIEIVQI